MPYKEPNTTTSVATYFLEAEGGGSNATTWSREDIRERIQWYMIGQAAFSCALLLLILAYFPAKPLTPPSPSGFVQRADYLPGIKALATNRYLCFLGFFSKQMIHTHLYSLIPSVGLHLNPSFLEMCGCARSVTRWRREFQARGQPCWS